MFIKIRFGDDELILCNPQCSVNNLLDSITARCGMKNTDRTLDLSDETGLVLRLNDHRDEYADLYLSNNSTYILVEKQETLCTKDADTPFMDDVPPQETPLTGYVPLLENCSTLLPKYKLRVSMETSSQKLHHHRKNLHPSGKTVPHTPSGNHRHGANKSPNRKSKRTKTKTAKDTR